MKSKTLATILGALCLLTLGGCLSPEASFSPLAANFKYGAPTNPADIEVYITKKPDYNYRELGIISYNTNPSQYDEAAVIQIMKKKAAQIACIGREAGSGTRDGFESITETEDAALRSSRRDYLAQQAAGEGQRDGEQDDEGGEQAHGFIVGMSIPIFSGRHKLSAAKSRSLADSYAADNTGLQEELRVRSGYAALLSQEEMIGKYKPLVENEDYYRILSEALNGGQISLRDYIIEIRDIAEATQKLYDMEYSFQTGYVDLTKYDVLKDAGNLF